MANNNDNSDYTKPRTDLFKLLPEVYQSDTNKSIFGNLLNRFLTKQETRRVTGYLGKGNPGAIVKRQVEEPTLHRQAFQLQPILYDKIGSVEHMASWVDIANELERLGVDIDNIDRWGELLQFNWVPPVDIDKIIHFDDYYWYDVNTSNSKPQYITIRSRCSTALANANFWEEIVNEFGETISIQGIDVVDNSLDLPTYSVVNISLATKTIIISGDASAELAATNLFDITGSVSNDGIHTVLSAPIYDYTLDQTTITVQPGTITANEVASGTLSLRRFDKIIMDGEFIRLFDPGFVFFVSGSTNTELNGTFWEVADVTYNEFNNTTSIQMTTIITDNTADGVISLTEQLNLYLAERDCQCSGSIGWDLLQWDDNPSKPLWGDDPLDDHGTMMIAISSDIDPGIPGVYNLWYDTLNDRLYQWDFSISGWILTWNKFSLLLEKTTGFSLWDSVPGCGTTSVIDTANQWIEQNHWLHKSDVPSFSIAKQAQFPILEYDWDLELNEWTFTDYRWKYRKDKFASWAETDSNPSLIELIPLSDWEENPDPLIDEIVLDEKYGDLTSWFVVGTKFLAFDVDNIFEVEYSTYAADSVGLPYQTRIRITLPISTSGLQDINHVDGSTPLHPFRTSQDDPWKNYGDQWLFMGQEDTQPVPHKTFNDAARISETTIPTIGPDGEFDYKTSYYAQSYNILTSNTVDIFELSDALKGGTTRTLQHRARVGADDIRVYINDIRQYGTYSEINGVGDADGFVAGIEMISGFEPTKFDQIRIEVGEAAPEDFGKYSVSVRMEEDNDQYQLNGGYGGGGNIPVSLVEYRKVEQVKAKVNQYPLFDIYKIDGSSAHQANAIFGYKTDSTADVNVAIGLRTVFDEVNRVYDFDQFLIPENNGKIYVYRDYSNKGTSLWFNPISRELKFWTGLNWDLKIDVDGHYIPAIVSEQEPSEVNKQIDGLYWVDTVNNKVFTRDVVGNNWDEVTEIDILTTDITLQSIWKKGLNDETYVPEEVDWDGRTLEEYNDSKDLYVTERAEELTRQSGSLTWVKAVAQATTEWNASQSNTHSTSGAWVGDWEIPDPMYFNNLNENHKYIDSRELLTHFNTIIQEQPKIPGYNGPREAMFHLIATGDVNYGVGGKIKQYNNSFDTMLSSIFVNNVTPVSLITFAHDHYESLLNSLKEIYRKNAVNLLTTTTTQSLIDFSTYVADEVILDHELNDNAALIYGDSTTFTEVEGGDDLGVRNWIATLPYLQLVRNHTPARLIDADLGINQVVHHDGHRNDYFLTSATIENIIRVTVDAPDDRTRFPGPDDPPTDTFGRRSLTDLPPDDINEFGAEFNTTIIGREGVYWYYSPPVGERTFYRLTVAAAGDNEPSSSLPDGTTWMDMSPGSEVLRVKETDPVTGIVDWQPAEGLAIGDGRLHNGTDPADVTTANISAWAEVDLDVVLGDIVFELETRLYGNAPNPTFLRYDFDETKENNLTQYDQYLYQAFLDYTTQREITNPIANTDYTSTLPFTWNYKFSTIGGGTQIIGADDTNNTFSVAGDTAPGSTFYIKNSGVNDGTWTTITAVYDSGSDTTKIYVVESVTDSVDGVLYSGILPSYQNDGSESGGDWRDYYQKLYGTPFPHLEPWILQGYVGKPTWWDEEYLNDDKDTWGDRVWKYKHGFDITGIDINTDRFKIDGDFRDVYLSGTSFVIDRSDGIYDGNHFVANKDAIVASTTGVSSTGTIELAGNVTVDYPVGMRFVVVDSLGNSMGSYTVKLRAFSGPPNNRTIIITEEDIDDVTDFDFISGGTYDPASNVTSIEVTTDLTVNSVEGRIKIVHGMWENIRVGTIPAGRPYSNGVVSVTGVLVIDSDVYNLSTPDTPTYNHFSVNIDNASVSADGGTTTYEPDEVFPPYWNFVGHFDGNAPLFDKPIRSVFYNFNVEIVSPGADYSFGDAGPVEWEWAQSSQWLYDQLTVSFRLDPIKYVSDTFGVDFTTIAGLHIDSIQEKVLCHCRTNFHGDIVDSTPYFASGTNQWYVNYNRSGGYDASSSDFRSLWTQWRAPLSYQFSSFIDTPSLSLAHRYVDITEFDYGIVAKKSPGVEDFWLDALDVSVLTIPPKLARYDNQLDWKFEINTNLPISRSIDYYDVENFQFYADSTTDICTLSAWPVLDLDIFNSTYTIQGNQTNILSAGMTFSIVESTGNDGSYEVISSVYNVVTNETIIDIDALIPSNVRDGLIIADYRTLPWITGFGVYLSTTETLPVPLQGDTSIGLTKYFIIVESDNTFKLARTLQDSYDGVAIDITSTGRRDHYVGAIQGTFQALNGEQTAVNWRHYSIDSRHMMTLNTPYDVQGMQTIVNIVDGYDIKLREDGWRINEDNSKHDPMTGRLVSWQLEVERFISYAYSLRVQRNQVNDRYEVSVDDTTDTWMFVDSDRRFITGDKINVFSSNGVYPSPFMRGIRYYIIRDSITEFRLAASQIDAKQGIAIDVLSSAGIDKLYIMSAADVSRLAPSHEINPMRHSIWYRPERGIISNIITGPSDDVRTSQLVFDQFGRPLDIDKLRIFREDKQTAINVVEGVANATSIINQSAYNNTHLGGLHLFVDSFEHVLKFNNYTSENVMIYDPFIGLNVTKFETLFNCMVEFTGRPNIGGYYLGTFFNQGAELKRNIEAGTEDIRTLYDSNTVLESNPMTVNSRKVLGYEGTRSYLDNLNLNPKSQFLFWKGQIQYKGSVNAMNAFINSRRFIDAKVDDFWAWKIAEFGSAYEKEYPEMYVTTEDARSNDFRMQFVTDADFCNAGYDLNVYDSGTCGYAFPNEGDPVLLTDDTFTPIRLTDDTRWFNQPDQVVTLRDNGQNLYFDLEIVGTVPIAVVNYDVDLETTLAALTALDPSDGDGVVINGYVIDPSYFFRWNEKTSSWDEHGIWSGSQDENPVMRHNLVTDTVSITAKMYADGTTYSYTDNTGNTLVVDVGDSTGGKYIPYTGGITIFKGIDVVNAFGDTVFEGKQLTSNVDYAETIDSAGRAFSMDIIFRIPLIATDVIKVVHGTSTLTEGLYYDNVNSNIVTLSDADLLDLDIFPGLHDIKLWGMVVNKDAQNPARLLDKVSEVVLSDIQFWDPARNVHSANAIHNIDLQNMVDPAYYNNTPQLQPAVLGQPVMTPWRDSQVGVTWLDTTNVDYLPYYDNGVLPDFESRLRFWGQLAGWGEVKTWEWVKSDVPPSEYNSAAAVDAGDISIPDEDRKSGTIRYELFEHIGTDINGNPIWQLLKNKFEDKDASIEGTLNGAVYDFNIFPTFVVDDVINVYVDGKIYEENMIILDPLQVSVDCKEASRVRFVQLVPTDEDVIAAGIEEGTLLREYEYTTQSYIDEFGTELTKYYFWVNNKSVEASNKNRTMAINDVEKLLISGPTPYVIFQNRKTVDDVTIEGEQLLDRIELQSTTSGQLSFTVELPIAANTDVLITLDGVKIPDSDISYASGDRIITLTTPTPGDELAEIRYTGTFDEIVTMPPRFTQAIVRGLRGWIDDDRRYTIRFTRDFTLRDNLENGSSALNLKNLHEEWKMFRQHQPYHVDRSLWDKITESMVGYKLTDSNIRVPSYERQLYDDKYDTDTQYGLRDGQAFTNGPMAIETILYDLRNPENIFQPVDINVFFARHSFDTDENIIDSMNTLYNTFAYNHVNRMLFSVLHDAFSLKNKYPDMFKTSMVSLHGIRPFQVAGVFDD